MLETERLNDLFNLLKEMTQLKTSDSKPVPLLIMYCLLKYSLIGLSLLVLALLGLATWQRLGTTSTEFHDALLIVRSLYQVLEIISMMTVMVTLLHIARHRKQLVPDMWTSLENALHRDAKLITRLLTFDKATLAYGLLQYRHRWSSREGRVAILTGDLRKLGLFPAVAALLISAATLFKEDSNPFLWGPW